jgi:hypothetical protein
MPSSSAAFGHILFLFCIAGRHQKAPDALQLLLDYKKVKLEPGSML